ncbi:hypothetical protein FISHEDRAFT_51194, partial [Fistulina hepatica ATCC 64428]
DSWERYCSGNSTITCLTRGESMGLLITTEAGLISLLSIVSVFIFIFYNLRQYVKSSRSRRLWNVIEEPLDIFIISLFSCDILQALGAVFDIRWVSSGVVKSGAYCTAQGVIQQIGETGVALATLASLLRSNPRIRPTHTQQIIALTTFFTFWSGRSIPLSYAYAIVSLQWIFLFLIVLIPNYRFRDANYQTPTPYWCWIGSKYLVFRIMGEYLWLWLTLFGSIVAYFPLLLWSRGNLTNGVDGRWHFSFHRPKDSDQMSIARQRPKKLSMTAIAYPLVYSVLVLPLSVARWVGFSRTDNDPNSDSCTSRPSNDGVPPWATIFAVTLFGLSGAANAALLLRTRPNSILFGRGARGERSTGSANVESTEPNGHRLGRLPSRDDDSDFQIGHATAEHESYGKKSDSLTQDLGTNGQGEEHNGDFPVDSIFN